ncbi:hypothetical protein CAAN1_19S00364 [[Candida] anglica]|uniref:Uncharacterized protein n=1 Tax=[Candida] anglica TaxID=148631 RepID=A0ABP0E894_9ASCO
MSKVPLVTRKNIKDAEATNAEYLAKINKTLGTEWTLDVDYAGLYAEIATAKPDYAETVGDVTTWYFERLADNLESFVNKDDMYKEALVEEVSANKIKAFEIVDEDSFYNKVAIKDGALVLIVPRNNIATNVDNIAQDLESIL